MQTVKPVSNTMSLSTANTVFSAKCVYIWNANTTTAAMITYASKTGDQIGQVPMPANTVLVLQKRSDETLASNIAVTASAIAFTD